MKKSILMMFLAAGFTTAPTFFTSANAIQTKNVFLQDQLTYIKIDVKDLPEEVVTAVAKDYTETVLKSASVADDATGKKVYKLSLEDSEGAESVAYYYADGTKFIV